MECVHSALDLFKQNGLQTSVEDGEYAEFRPLAALDDGPVEFLIKGGAEYLDFANTFLHVRAKVVRPDGEILTAADNVVPAANFLHTLFSDVSIFLNVLQITSPSSCYPYLSYIQTLLSYTPNVKNSRLQASMYYPDTAGTFQVLDGATNSGGVTRKAMAARSRVMDLMGRVHADLFHQDKYMLSHVDVRIKFARSKDAFVLMTNTVPEGANQRRQYRVELVDAALYVRKVRIAPAVALAHAKTLEKANAVYPITRTMMRVFSAPAGAFSFQEDNLFVDRLPNKLVVGFVRSEAFNGSYEFNPFRFEHAGLNFLALYHQGRQIPSKGLRPDFEGDQYTRAYMSLYTGTNVGWDDFSTGITLEDYKDGYTFFCFDLTPSMAQAVGASEITKPGPLRVEAQFTRGLPYPFNVLVYAEFDAQIEITKSREVMLL